MKKYVLLFLVFVFALTFIAACSDGTEADSNTEDSSNGEANEDDEASGNGEQVTINIGTTTTEDSSFPQAMKAFKEIVEEETNGDIQVNLHYDSALGGEREMVEGVSVGTQEGTMVSPSVIANFVPEIAVLDLPFIFEDTEHARSVMQGEAGDLLAEYMEDANLKLIGWGENGFRHITNNEGPIEEPADLEGMDIRTMENEVHLEVFRELGANPTPMEWGEVYTSLQQGVIDAQENPIPILWVNNLDEVQDYVSLSGHVYSPGALMLNKDLFDGLSDEYQEIVLEAAEAGVQENYDYNDEVEEEYIADLESRGMEFNEVDQSIFLDAVENIIDEHKDVAPDVYDLIVNP